MQFVNFLCFYDAWVSAPLSVTFELNWADSLLVTASFISSLSSPNKWFVLQIHLICRNSCFSHFLSPTKCCGLLWDLLTWLDLWLKHPMKYISATLWLLPFSHFTHSCLHPASVVGIPLLKPIFKHSKKACKIWRSLYISFFPFLSLQMRCQYHWHLYIKCHLISLVFHIDTCVLRVWVSIRCER